MSAENQTINDPIQMAIKGDLGAFNRLVAEHQDAVYSFAFRTLNDEALAQEIVRLVFQEAYRGLNGYRSGSFRYWLLRLAARACLKQLRDWHGPYRTPPTILTAPAEAGLQACLRLIPPELRLALVLVDLEGLSYTEAAAVLSSSPRKIRARLAQARRWVVQSQVVNTVAA